jgi:hypothetical protein
MSADLREFLKALRREGDVIEIDAPVDPHDSRPRRSTAASSPQGGRLCCSRMSSVRTFRSSPISSVRRSGRRWPSAATPRVSCAARWRWFSTRCRRLLGKAWAARDLVAAGLKVGLKRSSRGPVTEVREGPNLSRLPALTCWPEDGGPFITLPLVLTAHPDGLGTNLGMYRMQVFDDKTTGMHWQIGKGGGFHYDVAEKRGHSLPVSVHVGGPPALILSAIAPLPENIPELLLASLILGKRLEMVEGASEVPLVANAEFALVGRVPAGVRRPEGPFGDHYGYYSLVHDYPVFEVDRVYHRRDAIYPATVVGKPRQEDFFIGDLLQDLLSPLFPLVMPQVKALWSYGETGYHSLAGRDRSGALRTRSHGERLPDSRRRPALTHQVPAAHRLVCGRRPQGFPRHAHPHPRAHDARDRPFRVPQSLDGLPRLHHAHHQSRFEGRLDGRGRETSRTPARVHGRARAFRERGSGLLPGVSRGGSARLSREPRTRSPRWPGGSPPILHSPAGRWSCSPTSRLAPRSRPSIFSGRPSRGSSPPAIFMELGRTWWRITSPCRRPS